jgi:hypothetical protein
MGKQLLAGTSVVCILMVLAGANRGFDISDESLYMLLADPLQENSAGIFNYDLFFKLIFRASGYSFSLVELRIIRLMSYVAAAWAFTGFWRNIKKEPRLRMDIFLIGLLALMCGYAFLPPTLSYNSLTVVLTCCWLYLISSPRMTLLNLALLGAVLGCLVYVKVTVVLIFFPLSVLFLIYLQRVAFSQWVLLFIPFLLSESIFYLSLGENALLRLADGVPLNTQRPGYQVGLMLRSVGVGAMWTGISVLLFYFVGIVKRAEKGFFLPAFFLGIVGLCTVGYLTHITEEWNHLVLIGFGAVLGYYLGALRNVQQTSKLWLGCLLILPFLLHLGSNVYWLRIGVQYWVFWVFAFLLTFSGARRYLYPLIGALSLLLVFNGIWWHPFGQDKPLWEEKIPWSRIPSEVIQLDSHLVVILDNMKDVNVRANTQPLLAAYRIPGLVWLSGTQTPLSPGIWDPSQLSDFFVAKPEQILYNGLYQLPSDWNFAHRAELGVYQGDSILMLWD